MKKLLSFTCASSFMALAACTHSTPLTIGSNIFPAAPPPYAFRVVNNDPIFLDSVNDKVFFAFNRYSLRDSAKTVLDEQAKWLTSHPDTKVLIAGNADPRGTSSYNYWLAERRALATMNYLIHDGVSETRINTISYGKGCPIAAGHSEAAYALDRNTITSIDGHNPQAHCGY